MTDIEFVQATLAQITWYYNIALTDKVKNAESYLWYAAQIVENGWSRNILVHQIEYRLYKRQAMTGIIYTKISTCCLPM
jgi:predicted nuclease of restriction endonuclease-like (RecB) superfamily